ncbi:MAG: hypothetical protein CL933_05615 [Deltaproteobacteria bacterium]|nr:hypothetical protein [Deltaproteobacteria bacterium]
MSNVSPRPDWNPALRSGGFVAVDAARECSPRFFADPTLELGGAVRGWTGAASLLIFPKEAATIPWGDSESAAG